MSPVRPKSHAPTSHDTTVDSTPTKHAKHANHVKQPRTIKEIPMTTAAETKTDDTNAPTSPAPAVFLTAPPTNAHSPSPPAGFERPTGANYRGVAPRGTEIASIPAALLDLARFAATYLTTLGATAPPLEHLVEGLKVASGWTSLRAESHAWDEYCATQEGMAWQALRPLVDKLVTAFMLAADSNKALLSTYPGLAAFLGAKGLIAQKSVSTKRLNKKAIAEGKEPYHGAAGKKRQREAEKAALASAAASTAAPALANGANAPAQATPATAPTGSAGH
jgi:hypothetical protein